jgi:hypothetical protein
MEMLNRKSAAGKRHVDEDTTSAAATPQQARPSRQCKDLSLKRIRTAVQDCSSQDDEEVSKCMECFGHIL